MTDGLARSVEQRPARRTITRRALLGRSVALGWGALMLGGCAGLQRLRLPGAATSTGIDASTVPRRGGTLRISTPEDIEPVGMPYLVTYANEHFYTLVYDTLVSYDAQLNVRPGLATSYSTSLTVAWQRPVCVVVGR